jgi:hypothetical protein
MPGPALHFALAMRAARPFATGAERCAYLTGSVAPDLGYFPGGDRLASDLAHYVCSGRLTEALVRGATDRISAAFARGWATHVVADALVHPLINRAAHELVRGMRDGALTFADDPASHIRVEVGLDATIADRFPTPDPPGASRVVATRFVVPLLASAYRATYGLPRPASTLARSYRALTRGLPFLTRYRRLAAASIGRGIVARAAAAAFALARASTAWAPGTPAYAFARPLPPSEWLLGEVLRAVRDFPAHFETFEATGFESLIDANLDTGEPETVPYLLSHAAHEQLAARVSEGIAPNRVRDNG